MFRVFSFRSFCNLKNKKILNSINPKDKDVKLKGPHITKSKAVCSWQAYYATN